MRIFLLVTIPAVLVFGVLFVALAAFDDTPAGYPADMAPLPDEVAFLDAGKVQVPPETTREQVEPEVIEEPAPEPEVEKDWDDMTREEKDAMRARIEKRLSWYHDTEEQPGYKNKLLYDVLSATGEVLTDEESEEIYQAIRSADTLRLAEIDRLKGSTMPAEEAMELMREANRRYDALFDQTFHHYVPGKEDGSDGWIGVVKWRQIIGPEEF